MRGSDSLNHPRHPSFASTPQHPPIFVEADYPNTGIGDFDDSNDVRPPPLASEQSQAASAPPLSTDEPPLLGRGQRVRRPSRRVLDSLPEGPRLPDLIEEEEAEVEGGMDDEPPGTGESDEPPQRPRRVILRVRRAFQTAKNGFGTWQVYRDKPS